ncbi:single-stranded DNA-binding protein [Christensenella tenuis]|uniref:Single-stranded DNA-binding protein n=1 Tax=Christensenella tenuis TaxID=2763033 RepID=A0ABR7EFD7_9FIRM|nr:single-stranded DNA-binding protein [Christensenella tenuis]MBC5648476.1 single-stranded DNA-binding protein [Christensenella tenuis]
MNKAILVGNLTKDPEQRTTQSGIAVTSFTVAVQRRFKDAEGNYQADFINCVAWRQTAEFIAKYFSKGSKIGVSGSLQARTYDDANGVKRYVTEVVVDEAEFVQSKGNGKQQDQQGTGNALLEDSEGFQPLDDTELPF